MVLDKNYNLELKISIILKNKNGAFMKKALIMMAVLATLVACSRPETPPPTTPIDAPTVENAPVEKTLAP